LLRPKIETRRLRITARIFSLTKDLYAIFLCGMTLARRLSPARYRVPSFSHCNGGFDVSGKSWGEGR
jgi:hypothetical protein